VINNLDMIRLKYVGKIIYYANQILSYNFSKHFYVQCI
jgi:hypothetical protein